MKTKKKIFLIAIIVMGLVGFSSYYYVMHGGERNLSSEETAYTVSSKSIADEFAVNIETANKKYLEKAIAVKGIVTKITDKEIIIDNTIICNLKELDATIQKNQTIILKGRVVGYDDLMGELKLDQCFKAS